MARDALRRERGGAAPLQGADRRSEETETAYSTIFSEGWPNAPHRTSSTRRCGPASRAPRLVPQSAEELETAALYAGQSSGLVHDVAPAGELVRRIAAEAEALLRR